jgi:hypothetical protein
MHNLSSSKTVPPNWFYEFFVKANLQSLQFYCCLQTLEKYVKNWIAIAAPFQGIGRILGNGGKVIASDLSPVAVSVAANNVQRYCLQGNKGRV